MNKFKFYSWFSGLIDGEGCFCISLRKFAQGKKTLQFGMVFTLGMSQKEFLMLKKIKQNLKMGFIKKCRDKKKNYTFLTYGIYNKKDLGKLIKILNKHPLQSSKAKDFQLFKKAYTILNNRILLRDNKGIFRSSLTNKDKQKLINIRNSMNLTYNKKKMPGIRKRVHKNV